MILHRIKGIVTSLQEPGQSHLEKLVALLFYLASANLFVVFFVQGGYDVTLGPIHVHAYSMKKWLLLCLTLALTRVWLEGRRKGIPVLEGIQSPLILFLSVVFLYSANDRTFNTHDAFAARLLPLSLIREFDFDLDEFADISGPLIPRFLLPLNGHIVSSHPPWTAVVALPVFLVPVLMGGPLTSFLALLDLEKRAAVLIVALSVLILLFAVRRLTCRNNAWLIAVAYALGTSSFSTSSQALWQHGSAQLFLSLTIYALVRGLEMPRFITYAGLALGGAVICRPHTVLVALPIAAYVFHKHRDQFVRFVLAGLPPLLMFVTYNAFYFGSPFATGLSQSVVSPASLVARHVNWFSTPILEGFAAVLVSPSRGLFVYSPILLVSLIGMLISWREPGQHLLKYLSIGVFLHLIPVATLGQWWGGVAYGPRLLSDTLPIWCLLLYLPFERLERLGWGRYLIGAWLLISIGMHALGVYGDDSQYPLERDLEFHPELRWSWTNSQPVYIARKILSALKEAF